MGVSQNGSKRHRSTNSLSGIHGTPHLRHGVSCGFKGEESSSHQLGWRDDSLMAASGDESSSDVFGRTRSGPGALSMHSNNKPIEDSDISFFQSLRVRAWVYPALAWGAVNKYRPGYLRGSTFMIFWELLMIATIFYVGIRVPYDLAFFQETSDLYSRLCWKGPTGGGELAWDIITDLIHVADTVIQAHSAYWFMSEDGSGMWILVEDLYTSYRLYFPCLSLFGRSFFWDVMCWFPWHHIACGVVQAELSGTAARVLFALRFLRVFKIFRLWRLKMVHMWMLIEHPNLTRALSVVRMMFVLFFIAHFLGCIFFAIGYTEAVFGGWMPLEGGILDDNGVRIPGNWVHEWIAVFYWSVTTMTTIGYGDISAHTKNERIFSIFAEVMGVTFFAWLSGTATDVIGRSSSGYQRFMDFIGEIQAFLNLKQISPELRKRVLTYYGLRYPTQTIFSEIDILNPLPPGLRKSIVAHTYQPLLIKIPLLKNLSEETQIDICSAVESVIMTQNTDIFLEGSEPDGLYIVRFGIVSLSCKGVKLPDAEPGMMFGEIGLLGITPDGTRLRTARSKTEVELLMLSKESMRVLMLNHGDLRNRFRQLATGHLQLIQMESAKVYSQLHIEKYLIIFQSEWQKHKKGFKLSRKGRDPNDIMPRRQSDVDLDPEDIVKLNFAASKPKVQIPQTITTGIIMRLGFVRGLPRLAPDSDGVCTVTFRAEWAGHWGQPADVKYTPGADDTVMCECEVGVQIDHLTTSPSWKQPDVQLYVFGGEKKIGVATIPIKQALQYLVTGLTQATWSSNGQQGTLQVSYTPNTKRILLPTSLLKWQVRGILTRLKDSKKLLRLKQEVTEAVVHVIAKGDSGKTQSDKTSATRAAQKQGCEIQLMIENLTDQVQQFKMMTIKKFGETEEQLIHIKAVVDENSAGISKILEALGVAKRERITYSGSLEERLAATEIGIYEREQKVMEIALATARNVERMSRQINNMTGLGGAANTNSFGVGIMFEVRENFVAGGRSERGIVVKDVVLGGPAYKGGMIAPGDILMRVDDVRVEGYSLDQIEHLIVGKEGAPVMLSFKRPATGATFMAPMVRERIRRLGSL